MRTAISVLAVMAAMVLVGACFDPTRACSTNSDCVNGGTCDSRTKTCVAAGNPNDKTPPVFSIVVNGPPARHDDAKLTEYDPGSPDGGRDAFRRDESVQVTVTSLDQDVDAGSVKLLAHGVAPNPGTPADVPLAPCAGANPAASNPFCREGTVQLAPLPFEAFRGVVPLEVSGSDLSNNVGKADAGLNVTRWKWRYSAGAPIYTTPAIADDGTIVFGTSDGGSGELHALNAGGALKWPPVALGQILASPAIGTLDGGQQLVYVGTAASAGRLLALDLKDGSTVVECPSGGSGYPGPVLGSPAIAVGAGPFEGALAVVNGNRVVSIRPGPPLSDDRCTSTTPFTGAQFFPQNVVTQGTETFLGTADGNVRAFIFESGAWIRDVAWGLGSGAVGSGPVQLALTNSLVGTTSDTGVFALDRSSGALEANFPDAGLSATPGGPLISADAYVFGNGLTASPMLYSVSATFSPATAVQLGAAVVSTPLARTGSFVNVSSDTGTLEERTSALTLVWSNAFGPSESFRGSPTLGCNTPGTSTGVLYLGSVSGSLFAVVVDSPNLDPTAPWPKYQHDVRNTGNPTTPIQSCP